MSFFTARSCRVSAHTAEALSAPKQIHVFATVVFALLFLSGCSGGSSEPSQQSVSLEGFAINGPLVGATISIFDPDGNLLAQAATDESGYYAVDELPEHTEYRVTASGGTLHDAPYTGTLTGRCDASPCSVSPLTTVFNEWASRQGSSYELARQDTLQYLGLEADPFLADLNGEPLEGIDLGAVRTTLAEQGVVAWVDRLLDAQGTGLPSEELGGGWFQPEPEPEPAPAPEPELAPEPTPSPAPTSYTVSGNVAANGTIAPASQTVTHGNTTSFTVTPDTGYSIDDVNGCDGGFVGTTYTTGAITAACSVTASFSLNSYSVTPEAGEGGSLEPGTVQSVTHGNTTTFTVTPDTGYSIDAVDGCGGSLEGSIYTTGAITANCTVTAGFSLNSYTVTPTAGANGSISPDTAQAVNHGATTSFTLTPSGAYTIDSITGTCGGALDGYTYTTNTITADCTVEASFALPTPQDLAATAGHQVNLAWAPVEGATEYCVYVSDSDGINLGTAESYDTDLFACTGNTDTLYTTTSLSHGTRYYFVVTAKLGADESGASAEVSAMPVSRPVNDTGIDWCANNPTNNLDCPQEGFLGQDGDHGRDADNSLVKVGDGHAGFDFTRVCNSGELAGQGDCPETPEIGSAENNWACTLDNHTGLMWEVKVDDISHLRHMDHTYTWYSTDAGTNGDNEGDVGTDTCNSTLANNQCNTQNFVAAVNDLDGLCGHRDWRMPDRRELLSIVHNDRVSPAIDTDWFQNTPPSSSFWSSSPSADFTHGAWHVYFGYGGVYWLRKDVDDQVRLVRAEQ